jgi:hypothetical protein
VAALVHDIMSEESAVHAHVQVSSNVS